MVLQELTTLLGYELDDTNLKKADAQFSKFGSKAVGVLKGVSVMALKVTAALGAMAAAGTTASIFAAAGAESMAAEFEVLLGSAEAGMEMMNKIRTMGAQTPFQTTDLASGAKTMLAFGIASEKVLPYLSQIGDIAGRDSMKLQSLTLAFSQIQSTGKLMGQDLLQLINAGFNPLTIIAEKTGRSMGELKESMSKGGISAEMVAEAFKDATSEGGRFYQNMLKQSKTLLGIFSTLKDNIALAADSWGQTFLPAIKSIVASMIELVQGPIADMVEKVSAKLLPDISNMGDIIAKKLDELGPKIEKLTDSIIDAIDRVKELRREWSNYFTEIQPTLDAIVTLLTPIVELIKLWWRWQTLLNKTVEKSMQWLGLWSTWALESVKAIYEAFRLWFWDIITWLDLTGGTFGEVFQSIADRWTILVAGIKREFGPLVNGFKTFGGIIKNILVGIVKLPYDLFMEFYDAISRGMENLWTILENSPGLSKFTRFLEKTFTWILDRFTDVTTWISSIPGIDIKLPPLPDLKAVLETQDKQQSKRMLTSQTKAVSAFEKNLNRITQNFKTEINGTGIDGKTLAKDVVSQQRAMFSVELQKVLIASRS